MDLAWNETQQMLKSSARSLLAKECPLSMVLAMEKDEKGYSPQVWRRMAEAGWLGLAFPEKYGGAGGNFLDLAALLEEMGRMLTPSPFFSTVVVGGLAVLASGSEAQKAELLPKIAQGQLFMTLATLESTDDYWYTYLNSRANRDGNGFVLNGAKYFVPDAYVTDYFLVSALTSDTGPDPWEKNRGISVFLVPRSAPGVKVTPHHTFSGDRLGRVEFDGVKASRDWILGEVDRGWKIVMETLDRGAAGKSVEMAGGAQAVLEMTLDYLKRRVQFGRPVATFQALQHHLANMAMDVEGCQSMAYQAAWRVAQGELWSSDISMAKMWCNEAYNRICALAHQCHGGMGFTWEYDLQLYTRRAKVQEQAFGDAAYHRTMLSQALSGL
ncbi:MAG: acyl-CoA dehydrogenase [SAR202 cluster bacterium]|nr:acyl-CoA dehydrogenase [SAR202 cluster bacterium]